MLKVSLAKTYSAFNSPNRNCCIYVKDLNCLPSLWAINSHTQPH